MKPTNYYLLSAGLVTGFVLIAYFLILRFSGLGLNLEFRILDFIILAIGIYYGLKRIRYHEPEHFSYLRGLITGTAIGALACFTFALFLWAYLLFLDPAFMQELLEGAPFGPLLNPYIIALVLIAEGAGAGALFSFIAMNSFTGLHEEV